MAMALAMALALALALAMAMANKFNRQAGSCNLGMRTQ
jgi:hypothetical protein